MFAKESFVDDAEAKRITETIFIVIGCMIFATIMSIVLYWTYSKDSRLFSGILWTMVFMYSIANVVYTAVTKDKMNGVAFRVFIALHSAMSLISMGLLIFYFVLGSKSRYSNNSSSYNSYNNMTTGAPPQYSSMPPPRS
jgi:hypothetical protein